MYRINFIVKLHFPHFIVWQTNHMTNSINDVITLQYGTAQHSTVHYVAYVYPSIWHNCVNCEEIFFLHMSTKKLRGTIERIHTITSNDSKKKINFAIKYLQMHRSTDKLWFELRIFFARAKKRVDKVQFDWFGWANSKNCSNIVKCLSWKKMSAEMRALGLSVISILLTSAVIGNAYYQKKQFYPSVVYITKSNPSMAVSIFDELFGTSGQSTTPIECSIFLLILWQ